MGITSIGEMYLVGEIPLLFRMAEALARRAPAMAAAGEKVIPRKRNSEAAQGQVEERGGCAPQGEAESTASDGAGPHQKGGITAAILIKLKVGKRRRPSVDGGSVPLA